jgi:hypothetical protein
MSEIEKNPKPPYYAVLFTSHRREGDLGYSEMAAQMVDLASQQPDVLEIESTIESVGITVWAKNGERRVDVQRGE